MDPSLPSAKDETKHAGVEAHRFVQSPIREHARPKSITALIHIRLNTVHHEFQNVRCICFIMPAYLAGDLLFPLHSYECSCKLDHCNSAFNI